jgi:hypothetical protein
MMLELGERTMTIEEQGQRIVHPSQDIQIIFVAEHEIGL